MSKNVESQTMWERDPFDLSIPCMLPTVLRYERENEKTKKMRGRSRRRRSSAISTLLRRNGGGGMDGRGEEKRKWNHATSRKQ